MSDQKQGGIEWELGEAESAIVAAGNDPVALAIAFRRHAEAIRNMMQGALVPSFVGIVERVIGQKTDPIAELITGLRADVQQSAVETAARLKKHDDDIDALTLVVREHKADHDTRITSLEDYRADMQVLRVALAALSARIDSALPTEADQELSAALRVDEAVRRVDGDG